MNTRKNQIENINILLNSLPEEILPLATDLFTRIKSLDAVLCAFEQSIYNDGPLLPAICKEDGVITMIPNPILTTYNQTISVYNSTIREFFDIKDKHVSSAKPLPHQSKFKQAISACIIVAAGLIALLL